MYAFQAEEINTDHVLDLVEAAKFWRVNLDTEGLEFSFRMAIEKLALATSKNAGDTQSLNKFSAAVKLASNLPFKVNFYRTQNIYYDLLKNQYPELRTSATKKNKDAVLWVQEFRELGKKLSIKVE